MVETYCRIRNIPNILAIPGKIMPKYVFSNPNLFSKRNTGSIVICPGMIIEERRRIKMDFFPGKLNFAKAKPAIAFTINEIPVTDRANIVLFKKYRPMFSS